MIKAILSYNTKRATFTKIRATSFGHMENAHKNRALHTFFDMHTMEGEMHSTTSELSMFFSHVDPLKSLMITSTHL